MLFVLRDRIGASAFARAQREGLVHDVVGGIGLPVDVAATRSLRALMVAPFVPGHTWITGLGALWLEGLAPPPDVIDVAGPRGVHRTTPVAGSPPVVFHSGWLGGLPDGSAPRVATVTRACIDALSHSGADRALPAVASALRARETSVDEMLDGVAHIDRHTHYRARVESLVRAFAVLAET